MLLLILSVCCAPASRRIDTPPAPASSPARVAGVPAPARAAALRGAVAEARGDRDRAMAAYDLALSFTPEDPWLVHRRAEAARLGTPQGEPDPFAARGRARYEQGDYDGAQAELGAAISLSLSYSQGPRPEVLDLYGRAVGKTGRYGTALDLLEGLAGARPADFNLIVLWAVVARAGGDRLSFERAGQMLARQGLDLSVLEALGGPPDKRPEPALDPTLTVQAARRAADRSPGCHNAWVNLATAAERAGLDDEARLARERADLYSGAWSQCL